MESQLRKAFEVIFFGRIHPYYELMLQNQEKLIHSPLGSQNVKTWDELNHVAYMYDIHSRLSQEMKDYLANISPEEGESLREANRLFFTATYLHGMQDNNMPVKLKYELTKAYLKYIETVTQITNINFINNQGEFLDMLRKNENELGEKIKLEVLPEDELKNEIIKEEVKQTIGQVIPTADFELNTLWKHGIDKLTKLSEILFEDGFISDTDGLKNAFNRNSDSPCNWLKSRTALLYLLGNVTKKNENIPNVILDWVCKAFVFNNQTTTRHTLKTQMAKIKEVFELAPNKLSGQYSEVYSILHSIM